MKQLLIILSLFISIKSSFAQHIVLSNGIGEVNCRYSYGKLLAALGVPDSAYSFDPQSLNPAPKSLAYHELYYDSKRFMARFSYFMLDTLTRKTRCPDIELYRGASIKLNGDALASLDSAYVLKKYGRPESVLRSNNEMTISYSFSEKKNFSLLTFYYNADGAINKVRIHFGRYL